MVSREDHCLSDLLWRWRNEDLGGELVAVISNHPDHADQVEAVGLPFHHISVPRRTRSSREADPLPPRRRRPSRPRPLHADPQRGLPARAQRPGDQHPPQLPPRLRRRRSLPPRLRARGQADRRHRPLCDGRARRRPDHRPGRRAGRPPRRGRRHDPDRPRHRAPRPRPRRDGPPRRPRPPRRRPHDRLLGGLAGLPASAQGRDGASDSRAAVRPSEPASSHPSRPPTSATRSASSSAARYGDVFSVRFPFFGRIVYVADPQLVKDVFTGSPAVFHAGEANATMLEPALGPNSVLTLDDEPHLRQRKLLLPPFHGERVRRYGELIETATRQDMETWPVGEPFALRSHTQRITLAVILRAVFGVRDEARIERAAKLIDDFSERVTTIVRFPLLRRNLGPGSPWRRFVARPRGAGRLHLRGGRPAPGRGRIRRARRRPLAAAAGPARGRLADVRHRTARRARHRRRRRPRDHRDRPRLGDRAAAAQPAGAGAAAGVPGAGEATTSRRR